MSIIRSCPEYDNKGVPRHTVRGVYAHYCNDWDGLAVSEFTPEFSSCLEHWAGWRGWLFKAVRAINEWYWLRQMAKHNGGAE